LPSPPSPYPLSLHDALPICRLIELLADAGSPVSIPDILAGGSGLKQSSVYRNLAALEQAGVVRRLVTDEEFGRYELAEDLIGHQDRKSTRLNSSHDQISYAV